MEAPLESPKTLEHKEAAADAGLLYVTDDKPGIKRIPKGKGFSYADPDGKTIKDESILKRIHSLAIPPAYANVWISPNPRGHIQATGRDDRGRKQYRYHPRWQETRDQTKYERMMAFGEALPEIRKKTNADLSKPGLAKEKVLATVVQLLEKTLIRVGNEEYVKENKSFGLTTMRDHHVDIEGSHIHFEFKGKSRIQHTIDLNDRRLAKIIRSCQELPGQELFQYLDENKERHSISSEDVNEYLREIAGGDFTAKDFRTWTGTVLAAHALAALEKFENKTQAKRNITLAIEQVAEKLGNTKAICRKCYVHPAIINAYLDGTTVEVVKKRAEDQKTKGNLTEEETIVIEFLKKHPQYHVKPS